MLVLGAVVDEKEEPRDRQAVHEGVEEGVALGVDPVEVLEDDEERLRASLAQEQLSDRLERALTAPHGGQGGPRGVVDRHLEEREQHGQDRFEVAIERQELPRDLLAHLPMVVALPDPEVGLEEVDHREPGTGPTIGDRAGLEDQPVMDAMRADQLVDEARLPDPGVADHRGDLPLSLAGLSERAPELIDLRVASHEAAQPPAGGHLEPRPRGGGAGQLVDVDRLRPPLDLHGTQGSDLHIAFGQAQRPGGDEGRPGRRHLLQAGRQVRGLPHRRVVHAEIAAYGADDHLPRVQADADVGAHGLRPPERLGVAGHGLLHLERRVAGAHGVVLVGDRRAEQRHDPIAHDLVDGPLIPVDRLHHSLEHRIEELARLLGIAVDQELHRAFQVGKQDGDLLALALESRFGGEDLLGEVPRGVGGRAQGAIGNTPRQRGPTRAAELLPRADLGAALRAGEHEASAALLAESRVVGVLSLALGTAHQSTALVALSAFSSQKLMPISRYIAVAVVRCSSAFARSPVRR